MVLVFVRLFIFIVGIIRGIVIWVVKCVACRVILKNCLSTAS